ncbi:hypothetical protein [Alkaliphilus sp. B6464]|uniref:hypothetical protein n=1 Tax=Alkaliphilus sp. B6464 TaxID=2731219 RepID=UPI001BAA6129|nr:hypothetical protein [Alkaliphilus sp. B6464]QUH22051.1 hypothetical protein HYG84_19285 [Alkaliphilus sp. B6464]
MKLFLINPEQMLIGKLSKKMYKPFCVNDKIIIEKNLKNLLDLRLIFSGYYSEDGQKHIAETIALDTKKRIPYLIGYKKSTRDNFLNRYQNEYENIMEDKKKFVDLVSLYGRVDNLKTHDMRCIIIASAFTPKEVALAREFPIPVDFYTWALVENILIFKKLKHDK